jgi:hypothetical protein
MLEGGRMSRAFLAVMCDDWSTLAVVGIRAR